MRRRWQSSIRLCDLKKKEILTAPHGIIPRRRASRSMLFYSACVKRLIHKKKLSHFIRIRILLKQYKFTLLCDWRILLSRIGLAIFKKLLRIFILLSRNLHRHRLCLHIATNLYAIFVTTVSYRIHGCQRGTRFWIIKNKIVRLSYVG